MCFAIASLYSSLSAAQQTPEQQTKPSSTSDPATQTQQQTPAQAQPAAPAQTPATDKDNKSDKSASDATSQDAGASGTPAAKPSGTSNDRLVFALPNFLTVQNGVKLPPLSAKDKFKVVARGSFDYVNFGWYALLAGINQANNSEPQYGQGWVGYGKRYGTTWADGVIENFMVGAVFPSILRQDPRFYRASDGSFGHRFIYSASRIFITRGDSGHRQFNFSEVIGSAMSASISTFSYHPKGTFVSTPTNPHMFIGSDRTLSNTASVWVTQMGTDAATLVIKQFWPDLQRKMRHKAKGEAAAPASTKP